MQIRRAESGDAKGMARVHVDSWRTTYKEIVHQRFLDSMSYSERENRWSRQIMDQEVFVAENEEGTIVGFAAGGKERSGAYPDFDGELYAIYLLEEVQGQGIGKALVKRVAHSLLKKGYNSMLVLVLAKNRSRYFYESLGAVQIHTEVETIGGERYEEAVYGWKSIKCINEE
ncbi:GNAT family N-acetyltransferase [Planococcus sp. NCCP-2050]|uniref:GNAT family N-acetyltransferase n=1 Tax=Planococcus sp. NCCP-2050 TaxID=2944679 RepID=UPI00203B2EBB|nr:GNAT family N-acetyltransferase [Planococcus sp. NCCP-2050]GKW44454.1 putative N-acetyltransferase YuaI [Planococcus sp. NCCP-2050]